MEQTVTIHFLYGSKPRIEYRNIEEKVHGGLLGGHINRIFPARIKSHLNDKGSCSKNT